MIQHYLESIPLFRLLRRGSNRFDLKMAALVVFAGLANAGLLAIINKAANSGQTDDNGRLLIAFALTIAVYVLAQRSIMLTAIAEVEKILSNIRVRIADRIRRAELEALDHVGRAQVYGIISRETQVISQAASTITTAIQSLTMLVFSVAYIFILSKTAFFIVVGMVWLGLILHFRRSVELRGLLGQAQHKENEFLGALTHLLDGFKETRMHQGRSTDLYTHLCTISASVEDVKRRVGSSFSSHYVLTQAMLYSVLASVVFLLPKISPEYSDVVVQLTAAILFIIGPLTAIVGAVPLYSTANVAAENIFKLETVLDDSQSLATNGRPEAAPPASFERITFNHAVFQYEDRGQGSPFRVGPIDLTINRGEILFIVGGNGSGKSTLLRTLTGLYQPTSGSLVMDDTMIGPGSANWYRSHFSPIFSDYHLFDRLYGLGDIPRERVESLFTLMQIQDKTSFENGRFTHQDLSSGQRKRLALIVALLEDRPILVLDEWAADQDPPFRKFFYETLLKDIKAQGKTIIAATHDDRYFGVADRVVKMEYGEIVPYSGT